MGSKKIDIAKAKCTKLSLGAPVCFSRNDETDEGLTGFDIEAYTGAVVDRWWGSLAIEVSGITAAQKMPIFRNHNRDEIVGYSTKTSKDSSFKVSGVFSSATDAAAEVKGLAAEGFPWQASIGVMPKVIMEIKENASMVVNGKSLKGPAEVWLESEVFETSFVPLGADGNTSVEVFSDIHEQEQGQHENRAIPPATSERSENMNLEKLKADFPDLVAAIANEATAGQDEKLAAAKAAGAEAERERIKAVRAQSLSGHEALIESLAFDGATTGADAAVKVLAAERLARAGAAASFAADAPQAVTQPATDGQVGQLAKTDDEKIKAEWDKDPALQAEFTGDYEVFSSFKKAETLGRVRATNGGKK